MSSIEDNIMNTLDRRGGLVVRSRGTGAFVALAQHMGLGMKGDTDMNALAKVEAGCLRLVSKGVIHIEWSPTSRQDRPQAGGIYTMDVWEQMLASQTDPESATDRAILLPDSVEGLQTTAVGLMLQRDLYRKKCERLEEELAKCREALEESELEQLVLMEKNDDLQKSNAEGSIAELLRSALPNELADRVTRVIETLREQLCRTQAEVTRAQTATQPLRDELAAERDRSTAQEAAWHAHLAELAEAPDAVPMSIDSILVGDPIVIPAIDEPPVARADRRSAARRH